MTLIGREKEIHKFNFGLKRNAYSAEIVSEGELDDLFE